MTNAYNPALAASRSVLRGLIALNLLFGGLFLLILVASFPGAGMILAQLRELPDGEAVRLLGPLRMVMLLGICAVPLAHILLTRLLAMVETVRAGDPFVAENGRRLLVIARTLLGLQLLDLAFGAVAIGYLSETDAFSWNFSLTGWVAVLLLFVLARVFDHGARLREEMEGTV